MQVSEFVPVRVRVLHSCVYGVRVLYCMSVVLLLHAHGKVLIQTLFALRECLVYSDSFFTYTALNTPNNNILDH